MSDLAGRSCTPCEGKEDPLERDAAESLLKQVPGWSLSDDADAIGRTFEFDDYHQTMAFVNAQAWIAHREDHHPDLEVSYNRCRMTFTTHAIDGLSDNDFICAAKVNALVDGDAD